MSSSQGDYADRQKSGRGGIACVFQRSISQSAGVRHSRRSAILCFFTLLFVSAFADHAGAQYRRMLIEGTIQTDAFSLSQGSLVRVLHADSSIAANATRYAGYGGQFGVRISTNEGFLDGEKILFRVVVSKRDSFIARTLGSGLLFRGTELPEKPPLYSVNLFRNHPPLFRRAMPDTTISEGQSFRYRLFATDLDADTVSYSIQQGPAGAVIDRTIGALKWTPTYDDAGIHRFVVEAFDGFDHVTTSVTRIRVRNVNRPPKFRFAECDTTMNEGDTLRLHLFADDPDRDSLLYALREIHGGALLHSSDGEFRIVAGYDDAGDHLYAASVTDGSLRDSMVVRLHINDVDRPPVFIDLPSDTSVAEGEELRLGVRVNDPDGDTVHVDYYPRIPGLTLTTHELIWNPGFRDAGSYQVNVVADDGERKTIASMHIRVINVNRLPLPVRLVKPENRDSLKTLDSSRPIEFTWGRSFDVDEDDTLRYTFHFTGAGFDTTIQGIRDTLLLLNARSELRSRTWYAWTVSVQDGWSSVSSPDLFLLKTPTESVDAREQVLIPKSFFFEYNLSNPLSAKTSVRYVLPERSFTSLRLFNLLGEPIATLLAGTRDAGVYDTTFDTGRFANGVYMMKLEAHPLAGVRPREYVSTKKIILVR